ncbi:unnamed protein product [Hydatigera taeniaeformis]|uniref:Homeobox domain-containing protein n=1 Tax=Hydatigena taeniaeformis TaxID=6205 RepID=A0A0R3X9Q0_HYDTA|nr:unnamed protein product [Hydatigera taeniaeformis]
MYCCRIDLSKAICNVEEKIAPQQLSLKERLFCSASAQGPSRRERTIYTPDQLEAMEELFRENKYPDVGMREDLAARLRLSESRIQVWFKNRRAKLRNMERHRRRE